MSRLNILIVHNLAQFQSARRSSSDYVLALPRHAPQHNYLVHRIALPVSKVLQSVAWDAVLFDSTSLGICTYRPRDLFVAERDRWSFLAHRDAVKLVFPQDDANHGGLMDDWFSSMGVDGLFTVRPEFVDLVYPKTKLCASVHRVYSGYLEDAYIDEVGRFARPFHERTITVGQRVTMYPARGGRQGRLKGMAAETVREAALRRGLKVDISTKPEDTLLGSAWYRFLGNCKFTIGAEGGLSVWDPYGKVYDAIEAYVEDYPTAAFEEIENACFPGLDGRHVFSGFSPRILEAACMGCSQILVRGGYLGVLEPGVHYLLLERDFSNVEDVLDALTDEVAARVRIAACRVALVDNPEFRFSSLVRQVLDFIRSERAGREHVEIDAGRFEALRREHWADVGRRLHELASQQGFVGRALGNRVKEQMQAKAADDDASECTKLRGGWLKRIATTLRRGAM